MAKDTRKGRASAAKQTAFTTAIGAWLVRLIGGGGGIWVGFPDPGRDLRTWMVDEAIAASNRGEEKKGKGEALNPDAPCPQYPF